MENKNKRVQLISNSKPPYLVYWHHLATHTDPFTEGYIGITKVNKYGKRFSGDFFNNYKQCTIFSRAIKKYGESSIITAVLQEGLSLKEVNKVEKCYRPSPSIGWNTRQGGGNRGELSAETKKKISETKKGTNHLFYDKIFTPESREKIRLSKLGNKNMVGKKLSEEWKINIGKANKGKPAHENTLKAKYKKVICLETGIIYNSQLDAQKVTKVNHKLISNCCSGRQQTAGGFHWELYKEDK